MSTNEVGSASAGRMSDPENWLHQHGDYLYRFALSRVQDPAVAEDLVQETFMSALHTHEAFEGRSSERTWLTSVLRHKILDHLRKKAGNDPSMN